MNVGTVSFWNCSFLPFQDTKRTPRHRASVEPFHPWGRPGAGAPLYQWQPPNPSPQLKTKVAGKFKQDFYNLDWEQNNDNRLTSFL